MTSEVPGPDIPASMRGSLVVHGGGKDTANGSSEEFFIGVGRPGGCHFSQEDLVPPNSL